MTREEAIEFGNIWLEANKDFKNLDEDDRNTYAFFQLAIKALEHSEKNAVAIIPCGDSISRQAVLAEIDNWSKDEFLRTTNAFYYLHKRINSLPLVTPMEKVGQCKDVNGDGSLFKCDKCNETMCCSDNNYCPNCGVRMMQEVEDE